MSLRPELREAIDRLSIVSVCLSDISASHSEGYDPELPQPPGHEAFFRLSGPDLVRIRTYDGRTKTGTLIRRSTFEMNTSIEVGLAERASENADPNDSKESRVIGNVKGTFLISYDEEANDAGEFLSEAARLLFARHNVPLNVWPYWRELVQSALRRLGLPDVVLPMYRLKRDATDQRAPE